MKYIGNEFWLQMTETERWNVPSQTPNEPSERGEKWVKVQIFRNSYVIPGKNGIIKLKNPLKFEQI